MKKWNLCIAYQQYFLFVTHEDGNSDRNQNLNGNKQSGTNLSSHKKRKSALDWLLAMANKLPCTTRGLTLKQNMIQPKKHLIQNLECGTIDEDDCF